MDCAARGSFGFFRAIWRVLIIVSSITARLFSYSTRSDGLSGACALMASFSCAKALRYWLSCHANDIASDSEVRRLLEGFGRRGAGVLDGPLATASRDGSGVVWSLGATTSVGFTISTEGVDLSFLRLTARKIPAIRIAAPIET